jgi:enoyl-[acyl-carrier protein] reductase II
LKNRDEWEACKMSDLLDVLGSCYPIIQGPIGHINSPRLVAAVCEAGAFGMLALGFTGKVEEAKSLVGEVQALTDRPFGTNIMIMNPIHEKILDVVAEAGIKTVTTSAGSPKKIYPKIHALGMRGLHVALSLPQALRAEEAGADGVIASGLESGGLRSANPESSTMVLVPLVADHVTIPVVAAGGIADSRGYRAALALGAQGVQMGTRFIASEEGPAPDEWKRAIVNCSDGGTTLIPRGNIRTRVIINPKLQEKLDTPNVDLSQEYDFSNSSKAWMTGDFDLFPAGGGQVSALINEIKPVKAIIEEMVSGES